MGASEQNDSVGRIGRGRRLIFPLVQNFLAIDIDSDAISSGGRKLIRSR
jgi:hypothetical protein